MFFEKDSGYAGVFFVWLVAKITGEGLGIVQRVAKWGEIM
jgi:hypothetical protein